MTPRRRAFDGPWRPHWPRLAALAVLAGLWSAPLAWAVWRPDPATLALSAVAAVYAALCVAAVIAMAWGLGLLILDTLIEPLARRLTRTRS